MGENGVFPDIIERMHSPLQIVGPASGGCSHVVKGAKEYLVSEDHSNISCTCARPQYSPTRLPQESSYIILFLNPDRGYIDAESLFKPLIKVIEHISNEFGRRGKYTEILYEKSCGNKMESVFEDEKVDRGTLTSAYPTPVPTDQKEDIYEAVCNHSINIR